jgi:hypothetical protein
MFDKDMMRILGLGLAISTEIVGFSGAGMALGYGLQRFMGWETQLPLVVFGAAGMSFGFYRAYRAYASMDRKQGP